MATADDVAPTLLAVVDSPADFVSQRNIFDVFEPSEALLQMANAAQLHAMNLYAHNPYPVPALAMPMFPFVASPTLATGSPSTSTGISPSLAFSGVQMSTVVNPSTLIHSAGISPIIFPRMDAFFAAGVPISAPCAYLAGSETIPAICQPLYPQHYLLQQRPINSAQFNLPTTGAIAPPTPFFQSSASAQRIANSNPQNNDQNQPEGAHVPGDQPTSVMATEMPVLPPTLAPPPLRSAAMRMKRPAIHPQDTSTSCSGIHSSSSAHNLAPKMRRFVPDYGEMPVLPPTLAPPPLRSAAMRMKRPAIHPQDTSTSCSGIHSSSSAHNLAPKMRRFVPDYGEASASSSLTPSSASIELPIDDEEEAGTQRSAVTARDGARREATGGGTSTYEQNELWHPYQYTEAAAFMARRREADVNPMHNSLLSSRMAQLERERQANNAWFQRHPMAAGSLVGLDVVGRRAAHHSLLPMQRYPNPIVELSMALLQHNEVNGALGAAALSSDPLPIGASVERIASLTQVLKYVRDIDLPETENERCTVCLVDFETGDSVRSLRCAHIFHVDCIDRWLIYNKKCPVCRLDIDAFESEAA
ncbi:E3 ubiquitin-protein ligase Arkadia [Toxocara canis]|uniref:E3 ubiquitin-protein ligase Arkadia n=1 Tax=Toxocara canis TaxID=6265 RepID=A0A0B2VD07_TOXCA|nr:E3 ubiquitin-protein ligase Arkadia [Toxocara canis]